MAISHFAHKGLFGLSLVLACLSVSCEKAPMETSSSLDMATSSSIASETSISSSAEVTPNSKANLLDYAAKKDTLKRDIYGYYPPTSKEGIAAMKEAGVSSVIATPWACGYLSDTTGLNYANSLLEAGLNDFPYTGSRDAINQSDLFSPAWLKTQENLEGVYVIDEPLPSDIPALANQVSAFNATLPGKTFLTCVLDPGGTALSGWTKGVTYPEYLDSYCTNVLDALDPSCPKILLGDTYPLQYVNGNNLISAHHLYTIGLWGSLAKERGYRANSCIMADDAIIFKTPTLASLRFQINSLFACGIENYTLFTVDTPPSGTEEYRKAMWQNGATTSIYPLIQKVNAESQAYSYVMLQFTWDGVKGFLPLTLDSTYSGEKTALENLSTTGHEETTYDFSTSAIFEEVETETPILLSHFTDRAGNEAFYVMNYSQPSHSSSDFVTLSFQGVNRALVYRNGEENDLPLSGGSLSLSLNNGEGAFILPYKN